MIVWVFRVCIWAIDLGANASAPVTVDARNLLFSLRSMIEPTLACGLSSTPFTREDVGALLPRRDGLWLSLIARH